MLSKIVKLEHRKMHPFLLTSLMVFISVQFLSSCYAKECSKTITVEGVVADSITLLPLNGVNVFNGLVRDQDVVQDTTDQYGKYGFSESSLGGFAGEIVRFEKTGYQTAYADPFTEAEAGLDRCGAFTITRNVSMSPQ